MQGPAAMLWAHGSGLAELSVLCPFLQAGGVAAQYAKRLVVDAGRAAELGPRDLLQVEGPALPAGQVRRVDGPAVEQVWLWLFFLDPPCPSLQPSCAATGIGLVPAVARPVLGLDAHHTGQSAGPAPRG